MREAAALVSALDDQEATVLSRIVAGWSSEEITRELALSDAAFVVCRARLFAKLGARSTIDAVRIGIYADVDR